MVKGGPVGNWTFFAGLPILLGLPEFGLCWAQGAIAQLGERLHGMQEVSGSIPLSSTIVWSWFDLWVKKFLVRAFSDPFRITGPLRLEA